MANTDSQRISWLASHYVSCNIGINVVYVSWIDDEGIPQESEIEIQPDGEGAIVIDDDESVFRYAIDQLMENSKAYSEPLSNSFPKIVYVRINGRRIKTTLLENGEQILPRIKVVRHLARGRLTELNNLVDDGMLTSSELRHVYLNAGLSLTAYREAFPNDVIDNPLSDLRKQNEEEPKKDESNV